MYLFIGIHGCKATLMARLATLGSDVADLLLGAIGKISGVSVVGHFG